MRGPGTAARGRADTARPSASRLATPAGHTAPDLRGTGASPGAGAWWRVLRVPSGTGTPGSRGGPSRGLVGRSRARSSAPRPGGSWRGRSGRPSAPPPTTTAAAGAVEPLPRLLGFGGLVVVRVLV